MHVRQYLKSPKLGVINILSLVWLWLYLFYFTSVTDITGMITYSMQPIKYIFFLYLFLSYEFFCSEKRAFLEEIIDSTYCGRRKCEVVKFFIFLLSLFCEEAIVYSYYQVSLKQLNCNTEETSIYFLLVVTLYHFAVCVLAVFIGWAASFVKKRISGYGILVLMSYLFTSNFIMLLQRISRHTELYYKIADLFCIYERDYSCTSNLYYLLSVELVEVQRIVFWLLACVCVLVWKKTKKRGKMKVVIPFALMSMVFYCFWQPTSTVYADKGANGHDAWTQDYSYYKYQEQKEKSNDTEDFQVKAYTMKLDKKRILHADVRVAVDKYDLKKYVFTLYHGYHIKHIANQDGKSMNFIQKEDTVVVYNAGTVEYLQFTYQGCCKNYYTTSQGMYLPAYFAYYPMAGERNIYQKLTVQEDENYILYEGYNLECLKENVKFDVTILDNQCVYCNLKEKEQNHFIGESNGLTLLSGKFIETMEIDKCLVVYSYLEPENPKSSEDVKQKLQQWISDNKEINGKTIFIAPMSNYDSYTFAKDHVIGNSNIFEEYYERYLKTGSLYELEE